jgi:hypothetical protein
MKDEKNKEEKMSEPLMRMMYMINDDKKRFFP